MSRLALALVFAAALSIAIVLGRADLRQAFLRLHVFEGPTADLERLSFAPKRPWKGIRYVRVVVPAAQTYNMPWVSWREIQVYASRR